MPPESPPAGLPYLPPPPPPGNVPALLRWSLAVLKASAGRRNRAAIRRHQSGPGVGESLGTVAIAMSADLAMFAAKAAAAALTGSAAPDAAAGIVIGVLLAVIGLRLAARNRALLTNRSESPAVLDRIRGLLATDPGVAAVGQIASVYVGPHQLLLTAEIQPLDTMSGVGLCQLLAELRERIAQAIPRVAVVSLMPVVAVEHPPEPTPWDRDYWLRRFPDHEQA